MCKTRRYERNAERASTRAGHYQRSFQTTAGQVGLRVPKLRHVPFETAIIERCRRRESSVEEVLVEIYLAGVSVCKVEDITKALWGSRERTWGGEVETVFVLVTIGVNRKGYREVFGVAEGSREDQESWRVFLRYLKDRGLERIRLLVSDKSLGLLEALCEYYPDARWQRCQSIFTEMCSVPRLGAKSGK